MSFRGPDEGFLQKKRFFRVMPALDHGAKAKIINKLNEYLINKPENDHSMKSLVLTVQITQ